MKKIISVLIAAAMCLTLSVGAFAAQSDVDNLKNLVNNAAGLSASQKQQACAFLDDYSAEHADAITADIVSRLTDLYNTALATPASERSEAKITEYVNQGVAILAEAGITVKVDSITLANGKASITGSVSAADAASVSFAGSISAQNVSGGGSTAPDTSGVIKPTGVSADSVALLGIVLAAVLGTAVVGTRKLRAAE